MKVVLLPGLGGSQLITNQLPSLFLSNLIWINKVDIARGRLPLLDLNEAGDGPGPLASPGIVCHANGPLPSLYSSLISALTDAGHTVYPIEWDWRFSLVAGADHVYAAIQTYFGDKPFAFVAHSAGGLVARLVAKKYRTRGKLDLIRKIIYMGTPQFGTYYPIANVTRQAASIKSLTDWAAYQIIGGSPVPVDVCEQLFARQVAFWELLPFRDYGPYHDSDPTQISYLYEVDRYLDVCKYALQARLDTAIATQAALQDAVFPDRESVLYGFGRFTPFGILPLGPTERILRVEYGQVGDDTVEKLSAVRPDIQQAAGNKEWTHGGLPVAGSAQTQVIAFLPGDG